MPDAINIPVLETYMKTSTSVDGRIEELCTLACEGNNATFSFHYAGRKYFLKTNFCNHFPGMFKEEIKGLNELSRVSSWVIPKSVFEAVIGEMQFMVLNFLNRKDNDRMCFEKLGSALASLHKITESQFGFSTDNYIGTIKQCNIQESNWVDFFYLHRIEPHVKWCYDEKLISRNILCSFENMYRCLHELFPVEVPALLHGDLWTGNQMNTPDGPAVYDPAVYYGHREMDIAMTRLFGGFGEEFYISYNNEFPLEKDYVKRTAICNLYPLLVHVKLFGTAYLPEIITTVKRF